ncbi:hypothetical protein PAMA_006500 [Pampus argenteus]
MASRRPPVDEDPLLSGGGAPQRVDFIFTMDMDEGYGSMDEDEDPLHQQLPAEDFQQAWRPVIPPVPVAAPQQPTAGHPQEGSPEDAAPSTSDLRPTTKRRREDEEQVSTKRPRWSCEGSPEDSAPSTSGLSSFTSGGSEDDYGYSAPSTSGLSYSTKRKREDEGQVSTKRPRWSCEGSPEDAAPSMSDLRPTTKRRRQDEEQVSTKRPRWSCEGSPEDSAPSTSGLSFFTSGGSGDGYSAPSTSDLSYSTKRKREDEGQVSTKRPRWSCEGSPKDSAPSTSGLSYFTSGGSGDGYSAPSTSDLSYSTKRRREDEGQVSTKRPRWSCEGSPEDSAPSTSGLSYFTSGGSGDGYSAPSTSDLSYSTKRRREDEGQVSTKRPRWSCEGSPKDSAPSTSS